MYSDWERYLHDYAKRRGLPPEYIDMGFWRWKVLPPKMRQLAEGLELTDAPRYRVRTLPAAGAILREEEKAEQLTL